mmetsp:Transcript_38543/g.120669  ORF Transcript_38543/g.120669 Transcript_38543/m.120669 type:complete len:338 (-) Transcript_38543:1350-2363(-)
MDMAPPPEGGWTASLLLVTKFPVPGSSKTRLARGVGADAAASVAREMLRDLLHRLALDERLAAVHLILYFAPAERERDMRALIETLGETVQRRWDLVPMRPPEEEPAEQKTKTERLRSSDLGSLLANGLLQARERCGREPTLFIGMDTPHLDGGWLADALSDSRDEGCAVIHPSTDGGYVCLALPPSAPSIVFHNVRWSCEGACLAPACRVGCSCRIACPHRTSRTAFRGTSPPLSESRNIRDSGRGDSSPGRRREHRRGGDRHRRRGRSARLVHPGMREAGIAARALPAHVPAGAGPVPRALAPACAFARGPRRGARLARVGGDAEARRVKTGHGT